MLSVAGFCVTDAVADTGASDVDGSAPPAPECDTAAEGVALGLLATAILVVNNLRDRHTDVVADKRTLAVRFGGRFARWEYSLCVLGAYACLPLALALGWGHAGWGAPFLALPLAAAQLRGVWTRDGAALNQHLGGTGKLELAFAMTLCLGVWPWS